ncbi:hypothetical protein, partial [Staphylococcus aureus]|uniref:hypothetical protein n=1 Tax=Staphylococcus aureus TaxID=1280 RepID=UPI0038B23DF6
CSFRTKRGDSYPQNSIILLSFKIMRIGPFSVPVSPCYVLDLFYNAIAQIRLFGQYAQQAAALLVFLSRGAPMEDPRDSLNFQIGWFKA